MSIAAMAWLGVGLVLVALLHWFNRLLDRVLHAIEEDIHSPL
jgi:hypothetical protein